MDYRELNKATLKYYFLLPFIDQVLDALGGKIYFSFLDGFNGYNQIRIALEDQEKTNFACPWGTLITKWVESKALPRATEQTIVNFLFEEIFVRFGVSIECVTGQGAQFTSKLVQEIEDKYKTKH